MRDRDPAFLRYLAGVGLRPGVEITVVAIAPFDWQAHDSYFIVAHLHYVLIGGTAASITMEEAGVPFRGTKDLDIVLHVEVLTPAFGQKFWEFVQAGGYQQKEGDPEKKPCLYRFQKPLDVEFPYMLELFSRVPDGLNFVPPRVFQAVSLR